MKPGPISDINALIDELLELEPVILHLQLVNGHSGCDGFTLAGSPKQLRCACGEPMLPWLLAADPVDVNFRLVGDEDGGVGIVCRACDSGGLPVAYYGHDNAYAGTPEVVHARTITMLTTAAQAHLSSAHSV